MSNHPVVLAYSGRPGAARAITLLAERTGTDVVTVTLDLGQAEDLEQICAEARAAGAVRTHVVDAKERFAAEVLVPALRAGATGLSAVRATALARPIVAAGLVDVARMERASALAHGAIGQDRDAFARLLKDYAPELGVIPLDGQEPRADMAPQIAANLWGRTVRFPAPAETRAAVPSTLFARTTDPTASEPHPAHVDLAFAQGVPVAVNGIAMSFLEVAEVVDTIAGDHGVGRVDRVCDPAGGGTREITEAPAALTLATALADLEQARLDPRLAVLKLQVSVQYGALVDSGDWFSPSRQALDGFLTTAMSTVSGTVRVMLSRGACRVVGRELTDTPLPATASAGIEPAL